MNNKEQNYPVILMTEYFCDRKEIRMSVDFCRRESVRWASMREEF